MVVSTGRGGRQGSLSVRLTLVCSPDQQGHQHGGDVGAGHALQEGGGAVHQQQQGLALG